MLTAKRMMLPVHRLLLPVLLACVLPAGQALATTFPYSDFSSMTGLQLNGDAAQAGNVLRLVPSLDTRAGTAFPTTAISLDSATAFSTSFEFLVTTNPNGFGAPDGFTFLLQNDAAGASALGVGGQSMGYAGITPSVAVAFRGRDPNFIGVVTGGVDPGALPSPFQPIGFVSMAEGAFYDQNEFAWIDYNPTTTSLSVYLSSTAVKPGTPIMSTTVDLLGNLGSQAYVGFSAGNGGAYGSQDILNWTFTSYEVPEPGTAGVIALGLATFGLARRRAKR